jgi:hypothetical protein
VGLNATSLDVFVTNRGDMLTATGAGTLTPIPGKPGEFTANFTLTITGGSGKYDHATGTITFEGQAHLGGPGPGTFNVIYQGTVKVPSAFQIRKPTSTVAVAFSLFLYLRF